MRRNQFRTQGLSAGVLDSNSFTSLRSDLWVVFHGTYTTQQQATNELSAVRLIAPGAVVRDVEP